MLDLPRWQRVVDLVSDIFGCASGAIVQFRNEEFNVVSTSQNTSNFLHRDANWPSDIPSFCRRVIETRRSLYVDDPKSEEQWRDYPAVAEGPVRSYYGLPIEWPDGTLFGTICAIDNKATHYDSTYLRLLEQFREMIASDLQHFWDYESLQEMAITDAMTGVLNRRGFFDFAALRLRDAKRMKMKVALAYLDVNRLKRTNDEFGHDAGDEGMLRLVEVIRECSRESDVIARIGGDEFLILQLVDEKMENSPFPLRIKTTYTNKIQSDKRFQHLSVSVGYKVFSSTDRLDIDKMISAVDQLMYRDKTIAHQQTS